MVEKDVLLPPHIDGTLHLGQCLLFYSGWMLALYIRDGYIENLGIVVGLCADNALTS